MSDLLEHILSEDYVSASDLFESCLDEILEKKLYEMKQHIQAEAFGALSKADIEYRRKIGYRKASDVLDDPYDIPMSPIGKKKTSAPPKRKTTKLKLKEIASPEAIAQVNRIANLRKAEKYQQNKQDTHDTTELDRQDKLDKLASKAKSLKAAPRTMRVPHSEIIAGGEREKRAKFLKARGSKQAAKWLKATKTQRNVAGLTHTLKNVGKGLASSLGSMGSNSLSEENA